MTRHKTLTLAAVAVSVAATSGCAAIHRRLSFLHFGHHETQFRPIAPAAPATAQARGDGAVDGYYDGAAKAIERKDYATALDLLQAARLRKADDVRVLNAFGVVYDKLGRFDLSTRYYAEARALDPGSTIIANNMAYSLLMQQRATVQERPTLTALAVEPDQTYRVAAGFIPATARADADLKFAAPAIAEPAPVAPAPPAARHVDPLVLAQAPNPLLQRISFRSEAVNLRTTAPVLPALVTAPVPAPAARRFDPLVVTEGPNPLLQRLSFAANAILSPLRMDPLLYFAPAAQPQAAAPARQVAYVAPPPPPQPTRGRIVAVAPGVMRLELGSQPEPTVFIAPRGPILSGHPLMVVDATGRADGALRLRDTLAGRGWAIKLATTAPLQAHTVIRYDRDNLPVAQGLARSLPMKVELAACDDGCSGVRLIIGADAVNWKPAPHHADRRRAARA